MWKCHKCGKPVYFAERKQSLGYDWHPECLRCEECGKRLNPGQHAEHKGVPYCHVPCYGALFGPQLFGHGTRVESHKSFGGRKLSPRVNSGPQYPRSHLESKLKVFNQFYDGRAGEVRSREVNGRLVLEGALRIHWGVRGLIHLKEDDDQRTVVTVRKRNSCRMSASLTYDTDDLSDENNTSNDIVDNKCDNSLNSGNETMVDDTGDKISELTLDEPVVESAIAVPTDNSNEMTDLSSCPKSLTLPDKLDVRNFDWDELDDLLQVERRVDDSDKLYQTMPVPLHSITSHSSFDKSNITTPNTPLSLSNQSSLESPTSDTNITDSVQTSESSQQCAEINETQQTIDSLQTHDFNQQNGTMRRIKNYEKTLEECNDKTLVPSKIEKENINRTISQDDSWIEKGLNRSMSGPDCLERGRRTESDSDNDDSSLQDTVSQPIDTDYQRDQPKPRTGSTAIRRRPGARRSRTKLKRRCSINGHFYDRETSIFTPPHGSQMSVWVTSLVSTPEVINLILEKYKVDSLADNFALFVVRDNGEQRRLRDDEYPLLARVLLGPHEDVAKLFLFDRHSQNEVSNEVAQFLNLSLAECRAILQQYSMQEMKEVQSILARYEEMKKRIKQRMEDLKVRL